MIKNLLRLLAAGWKKAPTCSHVKPTLEALEDRTVPIAVQVYQANQLPQILANTLAGSGVSIGNVSYKGSVIAAGTFTGGTNEVGMPSGIVLDTGSVSTIPGKNPPGMNNGDSLGQPGDPVISALTGGQLTFDAASLNFTLVAQGPQMAMTFVFASNEFVQGNPPTTTGFDDTFIVTANGTNVATLSNGTLINPTNILAIPGILRNNSPVTTPNGPLAIQFNGLSDVLSFTFNVTPGTAIPIHISIADVGDAVVNSAVFIDAHSFGTTSRLTAYYPTSWLYNRANNTYVGYITIYNAGPSELIGPLSVTLSLLPPGVTISPLSTGWNVATNTYLNPSLVAINPGQSIRIAVQLSNPFHETLPVYFNLGGTIIATL